MPSTEHLSLIKSGVNIWNEWRIKNPQLLPDLSWSSISSMDLTGINLESTNLKLAFCKGCNFSNANLRHTVFFGANLENSIFENTEIDNVNFEGALLKNAIFINSKVTNCNFKLANLEGALFQNSDVTGAKKLKFEQLSKVKSLNNSILDFPLMEKIRDMKPSLLNTVRF